jgi:methionyl-tRNA synthetase
MAEPAAALLDQLERGSAITVPEVLFRKVDDDQVAAWTARFGGEP